jgi:type VI secretion system protein VasD
MRVWRPGRWRLARRAGGAAAAVAALASIAGAAAPSETGAIAPDVKNDSFSIEATLVGGPDLNPNLEGRASPVVVRVFELRQTASFLAADYAALFEHAQRTLGGDLVAQEEFVLRPGEIRHHDRTGGPEANALGLAAAFRTLDENAWRLTVPLAPRVHNLLLIDFDANRIRLPSLPTKPSGQ